MGLVQARLASIASVALSTGLLAGGLTTMVGRLPASFAAVGFATSALILFYGRLAYAETLAGLFLLVGYMTLTTLEGAHERTWGVVGGLALGAALATKAVVAPGVAVGIAMPALAAWWLRPARSWVAGAALGLTAVGALWWLLVWLPHSRELMAMIDLLPQPRLDISVRGFSAAVGYLVGRGDDGTIGWSLPLLLAAGASAVTLVVGRRELAPSRALIYLACGAAVVGGLVSLSLVAYHPNRYFVPYLPVAAMLVAPGAARLVAATRAVRTAGLVILAAIMAGPGLIAYGSWTATSTRTLPAVEDAAVDAIPSGAVVAGQYAPVVALNTRARTIFVCCGQRLANGGDLYTERGARYIVTGADPPGWSPAPPALLSAARAVFCFTWGQPPARSCLMHLP